MRLFWSCHKRTSVWAPIWGCQYFKFLEFIRCRQACLTWWQGHKNVSLASTMHSCALLHINVDAAVKKYVGASAWKLIRDHDVKDSKTEAAKHSTCSYHSLIMALKLNLGIPSAISGSWTGLSSLQSNRADKGGSKMLQMSTFLLCMMSWDLSSQANLRSKPLGTGAADSGSSDSGLDLPELATLLYSSAPSSYQKRSGWSTSSWKDPSTAVEHELHGTAIKEQDENRSMAIVCR